MELADSKPETRSPLGIDLNEIPSSSFAETLSHPDQTDPDSFEIVRAIHDHYDSAAAGEPPGGVQVHLRGEETCAACGAPEAASGARVLVCDACERGFHLACAGISAGRLAEEWVCAECVSRGDRSKRWPLGMKPKRWILDINASPPSDGDADGEGGEAMSQLLRKKIPGGNSFVGNGLGATMTYSSFLHAGNGFALQKASGIMTHAIKMGLEDILCRRTDMDGSLYNIDLAFPLGRFRNNSSTRYPFRNPGDIYLEALREYISERHGVLEEGWRVELKHSMSNYDACAVYCAPDGKTFDSMFDVACYLGLLSSCSSRITEIKCDRASQERSHPRKRKLTRPSAFNGFSENKDSLVNGCNSEFACDGPSVEKRARSTISSILEIEADGDGRSRYEQNNDGLPLQFEDFFVLCLGQVDLRPPYHDVSLIFPVGYLSCWHDKITASLFVCDVSDGGDAGPVFRVRRWSCSGLPVPGGATVLSCPKLGPSGVQNNEECLNTTCEDYDKDGSIDIILADPTPPTGEDIVNCLDSRFDRTLDFLVIERSHMEGSKVHDNYSDLPSRDLEFIDEIGEISTEERSPSSAWKLMSQKVIDICSDICKRKGSLKLFCKHIESEMGSINWDLMNGLDKGTYSSLAKYCSFSMAHKIPSEFHVDELQTLMNVLKNWLGPDRFGLDTEFVQEIIETLPGVEECSQYEFLKARISSSTALTVGTGLLTINKDMDTSDEEKKPNSSFGKSRKPGLADDRGPPPGKPITSRLPSDLIVDYHQVWELLLRFHEILGLEKPLSAEELEHELIDPWFGNSYFRDLYEREIVGTDTLSSSNDSSAAMVGDQQSFVLMETRALKDSALARIASLTYSRCSGVVLTKAHSSLLQVLISELQSKVAALVDPNLDPGEPRSKRGRRKDLDTTVPAKRIKLSLLPFNEFTWPELARRYMLAVWSMDGNLDSAEIAARESGKVFRCLHGDGGVLCGSLTGVAGMEADAVLLAEANKRIFGSLRIAEDILSIEDEDSEVTDACDKNLPSNGDIPDWAQVLEPVRKLPTNVGTRIRKCVYEALEKGPPEWARKQLEHSISKEVYKGNASGPTKKAVLQVLEDVKKEGFVQKSEKERSRKKITISMSDILMKKCRIVLRRTAAADDSKVFCNLLGRKLIHFNDNDDEGLLGSPAMVSRPLDFRTIDLRLAVGAYGGSHKAFLEDVRELWNNVRTAFVDQSDMVELADSLSENFETLYEKEVVSLVQKFAEYFELQSFNAEVVKEIKDTVASTNEIPTAPWEEGVCKICGIDKDDDSVLLCDTCDAEYHTYCLNPPLARIPEGNWYCPSCVASKHLAQDVHAAPSLVISRKRGKSYQGEVTRSYLEKLSRLAALMGEKDYWEIHADERTFLLKFLCDEFLNSSLIHQHLEQSVEITSDLLQKLRSFYGEWRNLKSREDFMASRAAKVDVSVSGAMVEAGLKDGFSSGHAEHGKSMAQTECVSMVSDDMPPVEGGKVENELNYSNRKMIVSANCKHMNVVNNASELNVVNGIAQNSESTSVESDKSFGQGESPQEIDESGQELHNQKKLQDSKERNIVAPPHPSNCNGTNCISDGTSINGSEHVSSLVENDSQANDLELNTIKTELHRVEGLIAELESQLLKLSVRRELLGSDSCGHLYWLSATASGYPRIIVERGLALKQRRETPLHCDQFCRSSALLNPASSVADAGLRLEGSKANCPLLHQSENATSIGSPWLSFETHSEIEGLLHWLNNDPNERELKEAICQKMKFHVSKRVDSQDQDEAITSTSYKVGFSSSLATKAATLLERKYGTFFEPEITDSLRKRGKKAKLTDAEKAYRCECLEPIWASRGHCVSCHRTFATNVELKEHDGQCNPCERTNDRNKENNRSVKGKGYEKSDVTRVDCTNKKGNFEISDVRPELNSCLIKLQNEEIESPFNFEEICSKFVTKDSNEELVQEIGLISSGGNPSFVPSVSPFVSDSTLMLIPSQQEAGISGHGMDTKEKLVSSLENTSIADVGGANVSFNCSRDWPTLKLSERDRRSTSDKHSPEWAMGRCCVVPQSSLRSLVGKVSHILRQLKINLLDMEAAVTEEAFRLSKSQLERRWAWRSFVKSAGTIYEMVQATIVLEDMVKTDYLRNDWWCWSSLTAAAKVSTLSSLALRIYALDAALIYDKSSPDSVVDDNSQPNGQVDPKVPCSDPAEKCRTTRKSNKRRKEQEG